jgi:catechol 2,3-dioxygenase-like lactoylglutathione lyase family enzyme
MLKVRLGNVTAMVSDMERAVRFYTDTLGFNLRARYGDEWAELETQGLTIGLHPAGAHTEPPGKLGSLSIGLEVENLESAMADLRARGVDFPSAVTDDESVRLAFFRDPDGTPLYLCEVKKQEAQKPAT